MKKFLTSVIVLFAISSPVAFAVANPFPVPPNPVPQLPCTPDNLKILARWGDGKMIQLTDAGMPVSKIFQDPAYSNILSQFGSCKNKLGK